MDSFFNEAIARDGPPRRSQPLSQHLEAAIKGRLPDSFVDFLRAYGIGDYFDRRLQYCDPREYASVLPLIFDADPEFSPSDCFVVAYSAFGELVCWSERQDVFKIDLSSLRLMSSKLAPSPLLSRPGAPKRERSTDPNVLARNLLLFRPDSYEEYDAGGEPMFARCVAAYGALERGECYGLFPTSAVTDPSGRMKCVERVRRVRALEHFVMLAQLGLVHLTRVERGVHRSIWRIA